MTHDGSAVRGGTTPGEVWRGDVRRGEVWRGEADDEWVAGHRSNLMAWLRRRFGALRGVGEAVSDAETGPYAGAPRNPRLRLEDDPGYATVRYATDRMAYTTTTTTADVCERCGRPLVEEHEIEYVRGEGGHLPVGAVRACRACQAGSWLRESRMPTVSRARDAARRNVV
jgi:hypothetical protein